jgi:hypothetical protein
MIYLVETYQMSDEARGDASFPAWLQRFNALVLEKNPTVESVNMYVLFSGPPEIEIWFGMRNFSALDQSAQAEKAMFQDPEVMAEFGTFTSYLKPVGRRIMLPFGLDQP